MTHLPVVSASEVVVTEPFVGGRRCPVITLYPRSLIPDT